MNSLHRLLPLTALLAVLWAQAFGMHRGYLCPTDDGGHWTWADHCHSAGTTDHEHDSAHHEGDRHEHETLVDPLVARSISSDKIEPPAPSLSLIDPTALRFAHVILLAPPTTPPIPPPDDIITRSGDWPCQLSRSIALRL